MAVTLVNPNGLPQVDIVVDQLLKSLKVEPKPEQKAEPVVAKVLPKLVLTTPPVPKPESRLP